MERDDIIEYSLDAHHSEEAGKKIRKKIWFVFWVLLIVTCIEVGTGIVWDSLGLPWVFVKWSFIALTIVKAFYIVMTFMHLGDERKNIRRMILAPYIVFVLYLIVIALVESSYLQGIFSVFVD